MAWNTKNNWTSTETPVLADVINGLANDDRTWGGAVDSAGYDLANLGAFRLNPRTLPTAPTGGTVCCDITDGKTKQYVDSDTGWLVIGGAAKGDTALWWSGSGAPSGGTGSNGDMYINTANGDYYGPKSAGSWGSVKGNLRGPTGATGSTGSTGPKGDKGDTGSAVVAKGAYVAGTTYAQFEGVTYSGHAYVSLVAANLGNQPDISPTKWMDVGAVAFGSADEYFTATAGQTSFTPTATPAANCMVFVNGLKQRLGASYDYQISGANVVFNSGLMAGDQVEVIQ